MRISYIIFLLYYFSSPNSFQMLPPLYLPNFMFFVCLKKRKKGEWKERKKKKMVEKPLKNMESNLCWSALKRGWYTQCHSLEEDRFSLSQQILFSNISLARSGILYPDPLLHTAMLSGLSLCRWVNSYVYLSCCARKKKMLFP